MFRAIAAPGRIAAALFAMLALAACAGPGNEELASFSTSGVGFAQQAPKVYDYAFAQAVKRDSDSLLLNRKRLRDAGASGDLLVSTYRANNAALKQRLESFAVMKQHAADLQAYFVALNALAGGAEAEAAGKAADDLANGVAGFAPKIKEISIKGVAVVGLIEPVAKLAVAGFTNARLQKHLEAHGDAILEAIVLQKAMFKLLLEIESDPAQISFDIALREELANLKKDLPADWGQRRLRSFNFQLAPNPISLALTAAGELEANFKSIVEGGQGTLARLERAVVQVEAVVDILETEFKGS